MNTSQNKNLNYDVVETPLIEKRNLLLLSMPINKQPPSCDDLMKLIGLKPLDNDQNSCEKYYA